MISKQILSTSGRKIVYLLMFSILVCTMIFSFRIDGNVPVKIVSTGKDSVASVKAFMNVYNVLMSPRCMNCHPSGDIPLQGEDSHLHTMNIRRGLDGKGVYSVRCSNCHQAENTTGLHMPPGNPKWGLPPANMRMVFQGRTPHELALQLLDPKKNGGRTKAALIDHMAHDDLVGWGWHPGDGRSLPPLSRPVFAAQVRAWLDNGAYAPNASIKALKK